jgi:deoxyribodipyrimidine photo-lyase
LSDKISIFWFRRDLRLHDNVALYSALQSGNGVLPIFIFDENILSQLEKNDVRVSFIFLQLKNIQNKLQEINKSLAVFYGNPKTVFKKIISENNIETVYTNHDYEPYARKRDKEIYNLLIENHILFKTAKDQVIFEKNEVVKDDGLPYLVFTPYAKKWKEKLQKQPIKQYNSEDYLNKITTHSYSFLDIESIGFEFSKINIPSYDISANIINDYAQKRNFPAVEGTSFLSTHLRFGTVSIREIISKVNNYSDQTFLNELIWREFFMQILWHFPHTITKSFKQVYDGISWQNNEDFFQKWCQGNTGYPLVDAGMRELNATGLMHNRVRMVVASFLCKHLLIDWRWGEAYFATKLLDYEQSSNVGNWQWAAGSGVDAAPYFRIFNPEEQQKKFDKDLQYIKKWVPEYGTTLYSKPIVDHKIAREKCLEVYKKAINRS